MINRTFTCVLVAILALFTLTSAQVPSTPDIFHLATCSSTTPSSKIIYFVSKDSPHPATTPTESITLPEFTTYNGTTQNVVVQGFRFGVTIDGDALSREAGETVGRGRYADIPTCQDTGYSIYNCLRGGEEVITDEGVEGGVCKSLVECTRANAAVC